MDAALELRRTHHRAALRAGDRRRHRRGGRRPDDAGDLPWPLRRCARELDAFYGDSHVLHDVSFTSRGRVLALLGRNGAGKSTSLNTFAGCTSARRGHPALGRPIERMSPEGIARAGIGCAAGPAHLPEPDRAGEPRVASRRRGEARQRLEPRARLRPLPASQGTRAAARRHALGRRAADARHRARADGQPARAAARRAFRRARAVDRRRGRAQAIKTLKADRLSIVLVEQNFNLALEVADDVVVLNTGQVVHAGSADAVRAEPDSRPAISACSSPDFFKTHIQRTSRSTPAPPTASDPTPPPRRSAHQAARARQPFRWRARRALRHRRAATDRR